MRCQHDDDGGAEESLSKALARLVDHDGEPADNSDLGGDGDPGDIPFAAFLDQQGGTALAIDSPAIVPQQKPAASVMSLK